MKYSFNWLNELTSLPSEWIQNTKTLENFFNSKGLEVESLHKEEMKEIVVGKIIHQSSHPDADRLSICHVDIGQSEPLSIVCGAKNQKAGDKVVVCLVGAELDQFQIQERQIRGELSQGMLASKTELGFSETESIGGLPYTKEHGRDSDSKKDSKVIPPHKKEYDRNFDSKTDYDSGVVPPRKKEYDRDSDSKTDYESGIWILPESAPVGKRLDEYLFLKDIILDIFIPPNRPDLLSHIGLARELSGLIHQPMTLDHLFWPRHKKQDISQIGYSNYKSEKFQKKHYEPQFVSGNSQSFKVALHEPELCPYYRGKVMLNVQAASSNFFMKKRLESLGVTSVNSIVDVCSWILLEWGQPLHAFDLSRLSGNIHIRKAEAKTNFKALNGKSYELCGDELAISDDKNIQALAGVIGGQDSSISSATKNIFIESAVFAPYSIRRTARRFGLDTLSSFHFSRGVFPETCELALKRACSLIQQTSGGSILDRNFECKFLSRSKKSILIQENHLSSRLGCEVNMKEFSSWMKRMGSSVKSKVFKKLYVTPPYYRRDLNIKEDLIEEWARLKGYGSVGEVLPAFLPQGIVKDEKQDFLDSIKNSVKEWGGCQAVNYSFVDHNFHEEFFGGAKLKGFPESLPIFISNPISQDLNSLRQSLLPGLFKNMQANIRYGECWGRLFEQGVCFFKDEEKDHFDEKELISFMFWGRPTELWKKSEYPLFFELKSLAEDMVQPFVSWSWESLEKIPFLHPKRALNLVVQEKPLGFIGEPAPSLLDKNKIREPVVFGEFNASLLMDLKRKSFSFQPPSVFPSVKRDFSLLIPEKFSAGEILNYMREKAPEDCRHIFIVDYYSGDRISKGFKSCSFRFIMRSEKGALSEKQINSCQEKIIKPLLQKYPIQIR